MKSKYKNIKKENAVKNLNKPHKGEIKVNNNDGYIIEVTNVVKKFSNNVIVTNVLKGINLSIKKNEFVVILGKSGSGKTTLMNILSGLSRATNGSVIVNNHQLINMDNNQLTKFRRDYIGYIFQEYGLLETLNVYDNVLTGFNLNKKNRNKQEIDQILQLVDLTDHVKKYPSQLSGGQQQRVAIARAIAKKPLIIFGDEPTGAMDSHMGEKVLNILLDINQKLKTTIVLITHDLTIAKIAKRVIEIQDGKIIKDYLQG